MANCKMCHESGWFLSVSTAGLCRNCSRIYSVQLRNSTRIANDCLRIIRESKNIVTKLQRFKLLTEIMTSLANYDERGVPTITLTVTKIPAEGAESESRKLSPTQFLAEKGNQKDVIIIQGLRSIVADASAKSEVAVAMASKTNALSKALLEIRRYKPELSEPGGLEPVEKRLRTAIQKIKLDDLLEKAHKAEFKEQRKKAFDHYSDALYFLKNEADDSIREENTSVIESAIAKLKAEG